MKQVKERYPHLLQEPKKQSEDSKKEGKGVVVMPEKFDWPALKLLQR